MTAYLDNNIIIDIEEGKLSLEDISKITNTNEYYYSATHLQEANEITGDNKNIMLSKRFNTLSSITKNNYLYIELNTNKVIKFKELPETVFQTINEVSFAQNLIKGLANMISEEQKKSIRQQLGISAMELNNYTPAEVIQHINKDSNVFNGHSMVSLIESAIELHPDGKNFGLHNKIAGVFELLDMIGYWKDKYNNKSNYARLWDSNHSYFSSLCDYFVSDDKRTRNKAKVAFLLYDINTKIISSKGEE